MAPDPHETATLDAFDEITRRELSREAVTMVLYVSITLLAALVAIPSDDVPGTLHTAALIWGGAAGLALAHWLAFDVGARLFETAHLDRLHRLGGPVSLAAALAVAAVTHPDPDRAGRHRIRARDQRPGVHPGGGRLRGRAALGRGPAARRGRRRHPARRGRPRRGDQDRGRPLTARGAGPAARATIRLRWAPTRRAPRKRSTATGTRTARRSSRARPATGRSARHA